MSRTDLSKKQWRQLEPHLPSDPHRGHAYTEHRRVINGIIWRQRTGAPWRDVPARYGPRQTCYDRFVRWSRDGGRIAPRSGPRACASIVLTAHASCTN